MQYVKPLTFEQLLVYFSLPSFKLVANSMKSDFFCLAQISFSLVTNNLVMNALTVNQSNFSYTNIGTLTESSFSVMQPD